MLFKIIHIIYNINRILKITYFILCLLYLLDHFENRFEQLSFYKMHRYMKKKKKMASLTV